MPNRPIRWMLLAAILAAAGERRAAAQVARVTNFRDRGAQVDWSPTGDDRIAFAAKGGDGYYDVHLADPDGSNDVCVTCETPGLPRKHVGGPAWHPRGRYLALVVEKPVHPGSSFEALPGLGSYCDIWCVTPDGRRCFRLTDTPSDPDHGILIPRFSPDGRRLAWTERTKRPALGNLTQTFGYWALKVADLAETNAGLSLKNIRTFEPGGSAFYEGYGFTRDGKRLLFCSSMHRPTVWDQNIYSMDATTGGDVRALTEKDYNEHASTTPDGSSILWMSNKDSSRGGTDWWIMGVDGGNKRRITYFNERGHAHDMGQAVWAGLGSFAPDGTRFVGDVQLSLITQEATIKIIRPPATGGAADPSPGPKPGPLPSGIRKARRPTPRPTP